MAESLKLSCRCGWSNAFGEDQRGLTISCPECGRDFMVTDDAAEFSNRNVGSQDFSFDEDDDPTATVTDTSALGATPSRPARPRRRRPGAPRRGGARAAPSKGGRWDAPDAEVVPSRVRAGAKADYGKRRGNGPVVLVVLAVGALATIVFFVLASGSRDAATAEARSTAQRVLEHAAEGRLTAAGDLFETAEKRNKFVAAMTKIASGWSRGATVARRAEGVPEGSSFSGPLEYWGSFEFVVDDTTGYYCRLELVRIGSGWRVHDYKLRPMTRAEWTDPRRGQKKAESR